MNYVCYITPPLMQTHTKRSQRLTILLLLILGLARQARTLAKSSGSISAPGLPSSLSFPFGSVRPFSTFVRNGSGKPPVGMPKYPYSGGTCVCVCVCARKSITAGGGANRQNRESVIITIESNDALHTRTHVHTCKYSMTDCGNDSDSAWAATCASLSLFVVMYCARSPTTLLLGVTCILCVMQKGRGRSAEKNGYSYVAKNDAVASTRREKTSVSLSHNC